MSLLVKPMASTSPSNVRFGAEENPYLPIFRAYHPIDASAMLLIEQAGMLDGRNKKKGSDALHVRLSHVLSEFLPNIANLNNMVFSLARQLPKEGAPETSESKEARRQLGLIRSATGLYLEEKGFDTPGHQLYTLA
jgi:hypothetical protein